MWSHRNTQHDRRWWMSRAESTDNSSNLYIDQAFRWERCTNQTKSHDVSSGQQQIYGNNTVTQWLQHFHLTGPHFSLMASFFSFLIKYRKLDYYIYFLSEINSERNWRMKLSLHLLGPFYDQTFSQDIFGYE